MTDQTSVLTQTRGNIFIISINRPEARNAVDRNTASALYQTFKAFDADAGLNVAVLTGTQGAFCAGADLKAFAGGHGNTTRLDGDLGPMGPTRLNLSKPVIAAVEGYAVAGGMELALWCDLRVISETARFGIFCRRFGVPLIDGASVRLPRLIGQSRAMDLVLTGREVAPDEAMQIGLANRKVPAGEALDAAVELARQIAAFPQACLRSDRASLMAQWSMPEVEAMQHEMHLGLHTIATGETRSGAARFAGGAGRHGAS